MSVKIRSRCVLFSACLLFLGVVQARAQPPVSARFVGAPMSVWRADDGGTYYLRQSGDTVFWAGLSADDGRSFTNVFRGTWPSGSDQITGEWADVPRGRHLSAGELTLWVETEKGVPVRLFKERETGGFGASRWDLIAEEHRPAAPPIILDDPPSADGSVTGVWSSDGRTCYIRSQSTRVWSLCLNRRGTAAFVFAGYRGDETPSFGGDWAQIPWGRAGGQGSGRATFLFDDINTLRSNDVPYKGRWRRIAAIGRPPR